MQCPGTPSTIFPMIAKYTYICSTTNLNNFILDPTEETCVDTYEYDCSLYLSFCDNTEYAWFAEVCKKSCGKCGMQINFFDGINVNVKNPKYIFCVYIKHFISEILTF